MQMQGHQTIAMMRQLFCFKASGPERSMTENQAEDKDPHRPVTETTGSRNMHLDFGRGFVLLNESTSQGVTRMPRSNQEFKTEATWSQKLIRVENS